MPRKTRSELTIEVNAKAGAVSALLDRPDDAHALLVLGHGAGAGMRHAFLEGLTTRLVCRGLAVLRYQFPYAEAGRRRPDPPSWLLATLRAAVAAGVAHSEGLPVFAGGKSMGGRMTSLAQAAQPLPGVSGLVFVGFPLHAPRKPARERAEHLPSIEAPMLFLQGTRDPLADLGLIETVCDELGDRATIHIIDSGDHSFHVLKRSGRTDDEALEELADATAAWIAAQI